MTRFTSTTLPPLQFKKDVTVQKTMAVGNKIGWLHTMTDKPGASFDLTIKDSLGRIKVQKNNCKSDTKEFGQLINAPTMIGEHLDIEVSNIKGADSVSVFLN